MSNFQKETILLSCFIFFFTIILLFQSYRIYGINEGITYPLGEDNVTNNKSNNNSISHNNGWEKIKITNPLGIEIISDRKEYTEFESIKILVKFYREENNIIKLRLEERDSSNKLIHNVSQVTDRNNYSFFLQTSPQIGQYNVIVEAIQGNNSEKAVTTFNVVTVFNTNTAKFLYVAIGLFGALIILIAKGTNNVLIEEILRFVFLSGIVGSLLASLLFTDIPFGANSPIGLETKKVFDENNANKVEEQWFFDIGNTLEVPIYVVVFGLIGGYIRYLYKTSRLIIEQTKNYKVNQSDTENIDNRSSNSNLSNGTKGIGDSQSNSNLEDKRIIVFYKSLQDITLFLLSPILAIAVYFLLLVIGLSGENAVYTLAVVSFSVGLVTENVIQTLIKFVNEKLSNNNSLNNINGVTTEK